MKRRSVSRREHDDALTALRSAHRAEVTKLTADCERLRGERDQFLKDRNAVQAAVRAQIADPDAPRKSLAAVLGAGPDRSWEQLLAEVSMLHAELTRARVEAVALSGELDEARGGRHLVEGGTGQPRTQDGELLRQLHLAQRARRELAAQLAGLQASHVADTRELHDLRQGVAS